MTDHDEQRLRALIKKFDKNGDGKITKEDFQKIIDEGEGKDAKHAQKFLAGFDAADVNKNGVLDAEEVCNLFKDAKEEKLRELIKKYDKDGNGKLTKADFEKIVQEGGNTQRAQKLLAAFDTADVNKNGVLDKDEVKKLLKVARDH